MKPALFIDRDGTIVHNNPEYIHKIKDMVIYDDAVTLMRQFQNNGYLIIIISNQSGIGRGYFTKRDCDSFNEELKRRLSERGVKIDAIYYCPHRPTDQCYCRKPNNGLVLKACEDFNINVLNSVVVGDKDDIEGKLARKMRMRYRLFKRD